MGDDWASKAAQRIKEREEQRRLNEAHDVRKASLLSSHAPMLWESLKETISQLNLCGMVETQVAVLENELSAGHKLVS